MAALALGGMLRFGLRPPLRTPPNVNYTTPRDTTAEVGLCNLEALVG